MIILCSYFQVVREERALGLRPMPVVSAETAQARRDTRATQARDRRHAAGKYLDFVFFIRASLIMLILKNMYLVPLICKVVRLILFVFPLYCGRRLVSERLFATLYYTFNTQTQGFYCKRVHPLCHHVTTPHHVISSYHR